jgi:hypothetical protein
MRFLISTSRAVRALCATALIATAVSAHAAQLPEGTAVRVESAAFSPNWHEGVAKRDADKCTRVHFKKPLEGGYTSASLVILDHIQVAQSGGWRDVDLNELLSAEPAECREEAAD